jgi:sporulation protein YlmC with PRC-barrel domain
MESHELPPSPASPSSGGKPWLASRLLRRQVVNASTVQPAGRVADVVFDPESCQVTALIVQSTASGSRLMAAVRRASNWHRPVASVAIDHIIALNGDVVMVDRDPVFSTLSRSIGSVACLCDVCELTILTFHGVCLGSLADLLLDSRGRVVIGYVVNPTKQAESFLGSLAELEPSSPVDIESRIGAAEVSSASEGADFKSFASHLRVIPASPRVRIGEELILVVAEVEPLRQDVLW